MENLTLLSFLGEKPLRILELELELHGIFWFHSYARPSDKYIHIVAPVVHNYPLTLAFMGLPAEAYSTVSGRKTFLYKPENVWKKYGFYVYPAIIKKSVSKIITFSMGGTGYVQFKPKTRASVPDFTANQVFLPDTKLKTYMIVKDSYNPPPVIRLGAKRYGIFHVKVRKRVTGKIDTSTRHTVTHPFNVRDVKPRQYHGILQHYAGTIALTGTTDKVIVAGKTVLACPSFLR